MYSLQAFHAFCHNLYLNIYTIVQGKWNKGSYSDLLSNSLNLVFKEMYGDQSREFVCGSV